MSFESVDTLFFDVGATLRYVVEDPAFSAEAERQLMELAGAKEPHDVFFEKLEKNWKAYRKLAKSRLLDVSEMELWLQYLLPDYPPERIAPAAARLTRLWRDHDGRRVAHEGTPETLRELKRRGYKLGVIANQNYGTERRLKNWNLHQFFDIIAASAELGVAKPDPAIFEWALKQAGCCPQNAVMVGDRMDNDMAPANRLGIHSVRLKRGLGAYHEPQSDDEIPEHTISQLSQLLDLL